MAGKVDWNWRNTEHRLVDGVARHRIASGLAVQAAFGSAERVEPICSNAAYVSPSFLLAALRAFGHQACNCWNEWFDLVGVEPRDRHSSIDVGNFALGSSDMCEQRSRARAGTRLD